MRERSRVFTAFAGIGLLVDCAPPAHALDQGAERRAGREGHGLHAQGVSLANGRSRRNRHGPGRRWGAGNADAARERRPGSIQVVETIKEGNTVFRPAAVTANGSLTIACSGRGLRAAAEPGHQSLSEDC